MRLPTSRQPAYSSAAGRRAAQAFVVLANGPVFVESGDEPGQVTSAGGATSYATFVAPSADPPVLLVEDNPPPCA